MLNLWALGSIKQREILSINILQYGNPLLLQNSRIFGVRYFLFVVATIFKIADIYFWMRFRSIVIVIEELLQSHVHQFELFIKSVCFNFLWYYLFFIFYYIDCMELVWRPTQRIPHNSWVLDKIIGLMHLHT
jgi:hypothetical protein